MKFSGVRFRVSALPLTAFQASSGARMKHHLAGTVNRLNVEHHLITNASRTVLFFEFGSLKFICYLGFVF
jgi:hypothetical protein